VFNELETREKKLPGSQARRSKNTSTETWIVFVFRQHLIAKI
jgi:hypothetical protein